MSPLPVERNQMALAGDDYRCAECGARIGRLVGICAQCVTEGPPCEDCGIRGFVDRHGYCHSPECEADRCDQAYEQGREAGW